MKKPALMFCSKKTKQKLPVLKFTNIDTYNNNNKYTINKSIDVYIVSSKNNFTENVNDNKGIFLKRYLCELSRLKKVSFKL